MMPTQNYLQEANVAAVLPQHIDVGSARPVYRIDGWYTNHIGAIDHIAAMRSWDLPLAGYCGVTCDNNATRDSFTKEHVDILKATHVREVFNSRLTWTHSEVTMGGQYGCE